MTDATNSAWVHNLDPFLIQFTDTIGIRWYGLAYLTAFVVGAAFMIFLANRGRRTIRADMVTDYITYCVLGTMIGGRVGYALFYSPDLLTDFTSDFPFWGVLKVWEGGMASHGGMIGVFVAAILFARRHKLDWRHLGDLTVLGGSVGFFFGRIANFINGELFGREAGPGVSWAVKFPQEVYLWLQQDKVRNVADASAGADMLPRLNGVVEKAGISPDQWSSWVEQVRTSGNARYQIQTVLNDIVDAVQNGNEALREALGTVLTPRHPSQLYAAFLEGFLTFAITFWFWRKPRKPGVVGALWFTIYAIFRIIDEQFRMPDADIGLDVLGLSRGQWLSVGLLVAGIALLIWMTRRSAEVISGWGPEAQALRAQEIAATGGGSSVPTGKRSKKKQ